MREFTFQLTGEDVSLECALAEASDASITEVFYEVVMTNAEVVAPPQLAREFHLTFSAGRDSASVDSRLVTQRLTGVFTAFDSSRGVIAKVSTLGEDTMPMSGSVRIRFWPR